MAKPGPGYVERRDTPLNIVSDARYFRVSAPCPKHGKDLGMGIRVYLDPRDDQDYLEFYLPYDLIRPFLIGGWDALHVMDDDKEK